MAIKIFLSLLFLNFIVAGDTSRTAGQTVKTSAKNSPEKKLSKIIDSTQADNEKQIAAARDERENDKATIAALAKTNREQAILISALKKGMNKFEIKISAMKMEAETSEPLPPLPAIHDTLRIHDTTEVSYNLFGKKKFKKLHK